MDERLSNQVYHYDKDLRKLTLATDTPNKRLDGIVAEPCAQLERIMRSLANSPPLAIWNLASRSLTCRFFFSSPDTS